VTGKTLKTRPPLRLQHGARPGFNHNRHMAMGRWGFSMGETQTRIALRGIRNIALLTLVIAVIIWDFLSIGSAPSSIEWALLFIAANAAFVIGGWYAFRYSSRRPPA